MNMDCQNICFIALHSRFRVSLGRCFKPKKFKSKVSFLNKKSKFVKIKLPLTGLRPIFLTPKLRQIFRKRNFIDYAKRYEKQEGPQQMLIFFLVS